MTRTAPLLALTLAAAALAGCHPRHAAGNTLDAMDNELVNGSVVADGADSLRSAITVDPARTNGAAPETAAPARPQPAGTAAAAGGNQDCLKRYGATLAYSGDWATKLPAELPLPPHAKLTEAAGHDGGCAIRIVSFAAPMDRAALVDWYAQKARAGRYGADRETRGGDVYLAGSKGPATFTLIAGPTKAGTTSADLVWVRG